MGPRVPRGPSPRKAPRRGLVVRPGNASQSSGQAGRHGHVAERLVEVLVGGHGDRPQAGHEPRGQGQFRQCRIQPVVVGQGDLAEALDEPFRQGNGPQSPSSLGSGDSMALRVRRLLIRFDGGQEAFSQPFSRQNPREHGAQGDFEQIGGLLVGQFTHNDRSKASRKSCGNCPSACCISSVNSSRKGSSAGTPTSTFGLPKDTAGGFDLLQ